jgi:hypothetical protein
VRPTAYEQVSNLRAESDVVFDELISSAEELSQSDDLRGWQTQWLKPMVVGSENIGKDEGVARVILDAAYRIAVSESVDLLWIDGKYRDAALQKGLDDGSMRFFDSDREELGTLLCQVQEFIDGFR